MKSLLILCVLGVSLYAQPAAAPQQPAKKAASTPAKTATASKSGAASQAPSPALMNPAALKARCPDDLKVKFTTTHGDFVVEVHRDWAPIGADRFYNLVKNRFFTDQAFFRYVPGFIVQWGIPANPALTKVWNNATIKDDPFKQSNKKGTIVFARTGLPNSRSTQFFINLRDNGASLDPPQQQGFTPFGMVVEGMDVVEGLYSGYGEGADMGGRGPTQGLIESQGKAYLDKNFPKLDRIVSTTIVSPETTSTPATPKKSTTTPATKGATPPPAPPKK